MLNNGTANGSNVQQYTNNTCVCQNWTLAYQGNGNYSVTGAGSGKVLDVASNSTADGANVQIWTNNNGNNQRFTFLPAGDGYFRINAVHSGKCVDVNGGSTADGANVQQWTYLAGANQQWRLVPVTTARMETTTAPTGDVNNVVAITPNPANEKLTVYFRDKATISVFNAKGQQVYLNTVKGNQHTIDISKFSKGSYFVKVSMGAENVVKTIIKE